MLAIKSSLGFSVLIQQIPVLFVVLFCGCATGSRMTLNHYQWSPEEFEIVFRSAGWRFANSFTSNGEHHEIFERRALFYTDHSAQVSITSYLPTRVGTGPAKPLEVFTNVTNFLSQHCLLSVTVIEKQLTQLLGNGVALVGANPQTRAELRR